MAEASFIGVGQIPNAQNGLSAFKPRRFAQFFASGAGFGARGMGGRIPTNGGCANYLCWNAELAPNIMGVRPNPIKQQIHAGASAPMQTSFQ